MKLKFDPNQQYQLDAVDAVVGVFDGQPLSGSDFEGSSLIIPVKSLILGTPDLIIDLVI